MATDIKIKHPTKKTLAGNAVPQRFIVAGTATVDVAKLQCQVTRETGSLLVDGELLVSRRKGKARQRYHWQFLVNVPPPAANSPPYKCKAVVNGWTFDNNTATPSTSDTLPEFFVRKASLTTKKNGYGATIYYPLPDQVIPPEEAQYFIAYGGMTVEIGSATMNAIPSDFIYNDFTVPFWSASFTSLDEGNYTLRVKDLTNSTAGDVTGLVVQNDP